VLHIILVPTQLNQLVLAKCVSLMGCRRLTAGNYASTDQISGLDLKLGLSRGYCRPVPSQARDFGKTAAFLTAVPVDGTVGSPKNIDLNCATILASHLFTSLI
jgi:hypothetical protein